MINKMNKYWILSISIIFLTHCLIAQQPQNTPVVFPSPEAYSLAKFGDIPVSLNTGIPSIDINLHTIQSKSLQMPINLKYHAGGIKVNEVPSWVGSGWALEFGGMITRATNGINDDEFGRGFYYKGNLIPANWPADVSTLFFKQIQDGEIDGMPDMYYYNFNGRSGKFYFDNNQVIRTSPYANIKIELLETGSMSGSFNPTSFTVNGFKKWQITDENGVKYLFDELEFSRTNSSSGSGGAQTSIVSAWYLSKITSPSDDDEIMITYKSTQSQTSVNYSQFQSNFRGFYTFSFYQNAVSSGTIPPSESNSTTFSFKRVPDKILFKNGSLEFQLSERNDLPHPNWNSIYKSYKIDKLTIKDLAGQIKKTIDFNFVNIPSQRLTLKNVLIDNDKAYAFQYHNMDLLPGYLSKSIDHWGYFNGQLGNNNIPTIIPSFTYVLNNQPYNYQGINKEPNEIFSKYGLLNKVIWPTGGSTDFEFQSNEYFRVNGLPISQLQWTAWTQVDTRNTSVLNLSPTVQYQIELWFGCTTDGVTFNNNLEPCFSILQPTTFNHVGPLNLISYKPPIYGGGTQVEVFVKYRSLVSGNLTSKKTGGHRVSKITSTDGLNPPMVKEYRYSPGGQSSGEVGSEYLPYYPLTYHFPPHLWLNGIKTYSTSPFPISNTSGNHIAYSAVEEFSTGMGKTLHLFSNFADYPDQDAIYPLGGGLSKLTSKISNDIKRGHLIQKNVFSESNISKETHLKTGFYYQSIGSETKVIDNQNLLTLTIDHFDALGNAKIYVVPIFEVASLTLKSESFLPSVENDIQFESGQTYTTTTTSEYNAFSQLKSKTTNLPSGEVVKEFFKYPKDFSQPSSIISSMISKNIVGSPIESIRYRNGLVVGGNAMKFKLSNDKIYLDKMYEMELINPLASYQSSNDGLLFDTNFKERSFLEYDANSNIINQTNNLYENIAYVWDYNFSLPTGKVQNATNSQISLTSFEAEGKGGWTYSGVPVEGAISKTGKKHYNLSNGPVTKGTTGASSSQKYKLTFWARRVTGTGPWSFLGSESLSEEWKLVERIIESPDLTISGSSILIDELRLIPILSLATTYTYDPIYGVTSITDPNNNIVYFEYNSKGQLISKRNSFGEIIEVYEYNYANDIIN
jgi:YD repeat-containing protein